jgi:hypothetical protein
MENNNYKERLQNVLDEVEEIIDDERIGMEHFLHDLFRLLFWKESWSGGYVNLETRCELIDLFDYYTKKRSGDDTWWSFDYFGNKDHIYEVIEKARKQIGLTEELPR